MIFLFRENPLSILCPIFYILIYVIRDNAILVDGYTSPEPFFATDGWVKSKTEPMTYSKFAFYLNYIGRDAGFEDKLTIYCFRRGCANAIDGIYPVLYY